MIGDFMDAQVFISENKLTTFEESVFGSMLKQMAKGNGFIKATLSKIMTRYFGVSQFL